MVPSGMRRICPPVAPTAQSDRGSSMRVPSSPAPPYTWHAVVSQVLAYEYRPPSSPPSASAYERAATACALSASTPDPPPLSAHDAGDSRGTTPRRYCSSDTVLIVRLAPSPKVIV